MTIPADYQGRQTDMVAFRGTLPGAGASTVMLSQELVGPGDGGLLVAGIHKLAQRALITLLTPLGSKLYRPGDGTRFLLDARSGLWRTAADVFQSFYASRIDVARQLRGDELLTDPPDERYGSIVLAGVTLDGSDVALQITLTSMAGNVYTLLTPIAIPLT